MIPTAWILLTRNFFHAYETKEWQSKHKEIFSYLVEDVYLEEINFSIICMEKRASMLALVVPSLNKLSTLSKVKLDTLHYFDDEDHRKYGEQAPINPATPMSEPVSVPVGLF